MSIDSQTGVGVVAGISTGGIALLADTGVPIYLPLLAGIVIVSLVAFATRLSRKA